jgi:hypothetical protein
MTKLFTTIPFSGFYNSVWDDYFIYDLEAEYAREAYPDACEEVLNDTVNAVADTVDHKATQKAIAKAYVDQFNRYYDLNLEFESLQSPREYNFTTDKIFCLIDSAEFKKIYRACDKVKLAEHIKQKFTSYDGFISYYSNDLNDWIAAGLVNFDHNQICAVIEAWLIEHHIDLKQHVYVENALDYDLLDACLISEKVAYIE